MLLVGAIVRCLESCQEQLLQVHSSDGPLHPLPACRYGKVAIFIFAAWGGNKGGIIAGLATGTALGVIVGSAADLMQVYVIRRLCNHLLQA